MVTVGLSTRNNLSCQMAINSVVGNEHVALSGLQNTFFHPPSYHWCQQAFSTADKTLNLLCHLHLFYCNRKCHLGTGCGIARQWNGSWFC